MPRIGAIAVCALLATGACADEWEQAARNGEAARRALLACWRYMCGWLQHADPETGLIPRNLNADAYWNAKDAAADNYPFMVLSSFYTEPEWFEGRMKEMLAAEQRVSNRIDHLPDDYVFTTRTFRAAEPDLDALIFGASEYAKDGLVPIAELIGPSPWTDRMIELIDDVWKHAAKSSEVGPLPSTSHEVCGDLMQAMSRMYWMTGNDAYRERAFLLADYFLTHHPPEEADQLRLDDHGCEVISGLSEVYYIASIRDPATHTRWQPAMRRLLDRVLEVARDEHGLLYNLVNPRTGEVLAEERTDNWGYNYNAFLVVATADNEPRYREAVEFALRNLLHAKDYPWEGARMDGFADALEGAINLVNRLPVPEAIEWADYTAERLLKTQRDTGVIEGWHGDGNFARTALMFALWKSLGARLEPWRADLRLGGARGPDGAAYFLVECDWPWQGRLRFDVPRHREFLRMPADYPRLNQFPEWFTVTLDGQYETQEGALTGLEAREGIKVSAKPGGPFQIRIRPIGGA
jgi:hypothetical protein